MPVIIMDIYIVILLILWWMKKIKPTKWIVVSPIFVWLAVFLCLAVPCRIYAPSGSMRAMYAVIPIVPNVKGTVVEIPIRSNLPLKKGDLLFRIDPRPYQYKVDALEAELARANLELAQTAKQHEAAAAATRESRNALAASESENDRMARESVEAAEAALAQQKANLTSATTTVERHRSLMQSKVIAQAELDQAERQFAGAQAQYDQAEANLKKAEENVKAGSGHLGAARDAVKQAEANEQEIRLALDAQVEGENPEVKRIMANLDEARWELEQTEIRAPDDGYVSNLVLRPGAMATNLPMAPSMAFVTKERGLAMFVEQTGLQYLKPGLKAEIALEMYPGRIFNGEVVGVVQGSRQGQIQISGTLESEGPQRPAPLLVILKPDAELEKQWLPPGVGGIAVVYTDHGKVFQMAEIVLIRVKTIANYLF